MFNAPAINERLDMYRPVLCGAKTQAEFNRVLERMFNKEYRLRCKAVFRKNYEFIFSAGGIYNPEYDRVHVIFNIDKSYKVIPLDHNWAKFKFLFSQTLQHECVHRWQYLNRGPKFCYGFEDIDHKFFDNISIEEEREYLSDYDELSAYGHDIAMEIKFCYQGHDPLDILRTIDKRKKLTSYSYYRRTFKKVPAEWVRIKKKLLLKTFHWLPHVQVFHE